MWWMLLVIIGCYAFAAMMARAAARRFAGWRSRLHVVLFAGNEEGRIEWYLRRLRRWSLRTGRDVRVTLVDCGSTDDTAAIAERFGRGAGTVTVVRSDGLAAGGLAERNGRTRSDGIGSGRIGAVPGCGREGPFPGSGCDAAVRFRDDETRLPEELLMIDLSDPEDVARLP